VIQPAGNSFFKGLDLTISLCTKWPAEIPRAQRPRARFPPQLPRLVIFNCSARLPTMSINAVPTSPPIIDHNRNSMRFPPKPIFPGFQSNHDRQGSSQRGTQLVRSLEKRPIPVISSPINEALSKSRTGS